MKPRKLLLTLVCLQILLLPPALFTASGASVDDAPHLDLPFEVVDSPYKPGETWGPVILRITAPNGQRLHYVSDLPKPVVQRMDANFDGVDDLAVMVSSGATNSVYRLFILQGDQYVAVDDGQEEGLFNLVLHPQYKLVESQGTSGLAGALHEKLLMKWEDNRLVPLRRAFCENLETSTFENDQYTVTTWHNVLHARVVDYSRGLFEDPVTLFDETFDMDVQGMEDKYLNFYQREQAALWQGLR